MSAPDDELVRRYHEASATEAARPGAHVRDAVRAHAQMLSAATAAATAAPPPAPGRAAANQSRWKLSALATVAVLGLAGLLMLQFERGTPEEKEITHGPRRAEMPAPARVPPPSPAPTTDTAAKRGAESPAASAQPGTAPAPAKPSAPAMAARPAPAPSQAPAGAPALAQEPFAQSHRRSTGEEGPAERRAPLSKESAAPAADAVLAESARAAAPAPTANMASRAPLSRGLHDAARAGNAPQVHNLVRQGAAVDTRDSAGRTPLMLAAMHGQTTTVRQLLALGANPALVDAEGLNAAEQARLRGHAAIAELLDGAR